jgi:hypothetical protein
MTGEIAIAHVAQDVLDTFDVPNRLVHIRNFVWRGGDLVLSANDDGVAYALTAHWDEPLLEPLPSQPGLAPAKSSVVEGRWRARRVGYALRIGIDLRMPSAIAITAERPLSFVPYLGRPRTDVAHALDTALRGYVNAFLDRCAPVPDARAKAAADLARLAGRGALANDRR